MKTFIRKIYDSRFYLTGLCILYFVLAGIFIYLIDYYPKGEIENFLKKWVPWNLRAAFLFLMIGIVICRRDIAESIKSLWKSEITDNDEKSRRNIKGLLLIVLVLAAFVMTSFVAPRVHRIYYDEDIYASMGQVIALTGQTGMCNFGQFDYGEFNATWLSYYKEPSGWPFLISLVFQIFGTNELYVFILNNMIFAAGVLVVFFITHVLSGAFFPSYLAALIFTLIPHNVIWSNTAAAEPSAAFFAGLSVLCLAVYLKTFKSRHLFMLAVILPIACQMRAESGLIVIWAVITFLVCYTLNRPSPAERERQSHPHPYPLPSREREESEEDKPGGMHENVSERGGVIEILFRKDLWTAGFMTLNFLMPHFLHLYATSGQSWGAQGAKFSVDFFWKNLAVNGPYYLDNALFPALFAVLAVIGLVFSRYNLKWRLMIFLWFFLFWSLFLFFYAGSYRYGADVRFALVTYMPLAVLAGMGMERIRAWIEGIDNIKRGLKSAATIEDREQANDGKSALTENKRITIKSVDALIILILIFTWMPFLPMIRTVGQEAWGARYDHYYAREFIKKIPERSIVLTHIPTMFFVWGQSAIQSYAGIQNPEVIKSLMDKYQGNVYFHDNFWCNIHSDPNRKVCEEIREKYDLEEISRAREQTYEYGLYKMKIK